MSAWMTILIVFGCLCGGGLILLIAFGFVVGGRFHESQRMQAKVDARTIQSVAERYASDHPGQCPTVEQLRSERELSEASKITDPWGETFRIVCRGEDVNVMSFGPDRLAGTTDDIRTP
jgi:hypothetical protein